MEALLIYFAKSSALMCMFFLAYYFLLRKETFFKSNRWYLLSGLVISVALPLVTFKKVVWVEPAGKGFDWNTLAQTIPYTNVPAPEVYEIDWFLVVLLGYAIGTVAFLLKFLIDFKALSKLLNQKNIVRQEDYKFLDISENVSPFSYFNYIVYNSSLYSEAELENILEHEKVHSSQNHTLDVLIARIFCIVFWYNPFIWMYKKAILQNLEFIADSEAAKNISDIKAYQRTLLKITTHDSCVVLTNHFFQSLIKKRIVMLNKVQSKKWNSWKYTLVIPALIVFMLYFQVQMVAQEKQAPVVTVITQDGIEVVVNKNSTDAELKSESERAKKEGISLKFSKVKRNSNGEITAIKAEYKDQNGKAGTTQVRSDDPIKPIRFFKSSNNIGFGSTKVISAYSASKKGDSDSTISYSYSNSQTQETPEIPEIPEIPEVPEIPEMPEFESLAAIENNLSKSITFNANNSNGKITYVIDGEIIDIDTDKIIAELDPKMIEKIKIVKSDFSNGVKNKSGVIYIDTKKITKEAMKLAQESIKKARIEIERSKPEIERAKKEIENSKPEIEKAKEEIKKARLEIEQAKIEVQKAKAEIDKAKAEIEKAKAASKKDKK